MIEICKILGISRQGFYKARKKKRKKGLQEEIIIGLVHSQRRKMPMLGGKKLYRLMTADFERLKIKLGRDKFFSILRKNGLLIHRKKRYAKTTDSSHRFWIYDNMIKEIEPEGINKIWVSDITYVRVGDSFCYLALITDLYSRKIVGYDISESLNLEGSIRALKMAMRRKGDLSGLIHHSDRGIQYCSNIYTELLISRKIKISMAEKGNPYENAVAERVNGILKEEFLLGETFKTKQQAYRSVREAIETYNKLRPHMSIDYMTPNQKYAA
ncbi:MAG TPA: IS3 family transposase [Ignavibacteria bacterium]|nr:IS3 family transposase [Ignavibacteria bacterium]HMR41992.1 IS3 family transposase [Ignavibacteria bacterium]HMR42024.1 IS3 family transposase [Ignavibacteria bacterium]